MSGFEQVTRLSTVPSVAAQPDTGIDRVAEGMALRSALAVLLPSRAAAHAIEGLDLSGHALVPAGGKSANRSRHEVVLSTVMDPMARAAKAAMALRRAQHSILGVRREAVSLGAGDAEVANALLKADRSTFLVHVAAELALAGAPELARHVEAMDGFAPVVDAYRRGARRGGARIATAMAFAAAAEAALPESIPEGPTGRAIGVARRLAMSSPAGAAYPDRPFTQVFAAVEAAVRSRVVSAMDEIGFPGMRSAA